jgi:uncharacterized protein (DUF2147 family)
MFRNIIALLLVLSFTSFSFRDTNKNELHTFIEHQGDLIQGTWITVEKNLTVEVFKQGDSYSGKIVDFTCKCPDGKAQNDKIGAHPPHPKCRNKHWINLKTMWNLKYQGNYSWSEGFVKDPKANKVYDCTVTKSGHKLDVRGYWGIEFFGKSLNFTRVH